MDVKEVLIGVGFSILGFLATWAWQKIEKSGDKQLQDLESKLEKNTEAHIQLSLAMVELKGEVRNLTEKLSPIPKMQHDIAHLHALRRSLDLKAEREE